jgi:hypothetical protein
MRTSNLSLALIAIPFAVACGNEVVVEPGGTGGSGAGGSTSTHVSSSSTTGSTTGSTSSSSSSTGAGGIGEPSNVYPAPHPDAPQVEGYGGSVMNAPHIIPVFFQGDDPTIQPGMMTFFSELPSTAYWAATTAEYGVTSLSVDAPVVLTEAPPSTIDDNQIQTWLAAKIQQQAPGFTASDVNALYIVHYPASTTITLQGSVSCQGFGGYHNATTLDPAHGSAEVAYAVMPRCGQFGGLFGLDALTGPTSHEILEAVTDPHPLTSPGLQVAPQFLAWEFTLGGEVGDLCVQDQDSFGFFTGLDHAAQRSWSNVAAKASHDPCVPAPAGVYFNAAPVMKDQIHIQGYPIDGVLIPLGQQKTIDVKLFSDGPTGGPFDVSVYDASQMMGGPSALDLSLDETAGQNGQTLHLTLTPTSSGQYGVEPFLVVAELNGKRHLWAGVVGQQ